MRVHDRYDTPTIQEIADGVGVSKATAYVSIRCVKTEFDTAGRSITGKDEGTVDPVPVLGNIACGIPEVREKHRGICQLPVCWQGDFILRAYGDSMVEAGIEDGDLVLIRQQNYADEGQIVVALIDDDATLKRFYPEPQKHRIRLHPENSHMDDIIVDHCEIQGVAVKVLKDLE